MVIEGCKGVSRAGLESQLNDAFKFLSDRITTIKMLDPANSNNVISNEITTEQKNRIKRLADQAINARSWGEVFQ